MGRDAVPVAATGPTGLFVYGTLMPGHLRWPLLAGEAASWTPMEVAGVLYDTGSGWPAAVLRHAHEPAAAPASGAPASLVPGWHVELRGGGSQVLWRRLDDVEGVSIDASPQDRFARILVAPPGDGAVLWAYSATRVEPTWALIDRWRGGLER
jgi:hypothetical protein